MNTRDTLALTFSEHENLTPHAATEFDALTARLATQTAHRSYRPLGAGLAAAAVAAAITVGVVASPTPHHAAPVAVGTSARPAVQPAVQQVAFTRRIPARRGADGITRPTIGVAAGWLPQGVDLVETSSSATAGQGREWQFTLGGHRALLALGTVAGNTLPKVGKSGGTGEDTTIQGHPARVFHSAGYFDAWIVVGNTTVIVQVQPQSERLGVEADLVSIGRHVADTFTLGGQDTVPVSAILTTAPAGSQVTGLDSGTAGGRPFSNYTLNSASGAQINIGGAMVGAKHPIPVTGPAGRAVQGKSTVVTTFAGHTYLVVKWSSKVVIELVTGDGAQTLNDLYTLADGIRFVG